MKAWALLAVPLLADIAPPSRSFDAARCGLVRTIAPLGGELACAAYSRDGRHLAVGCSLWVRVYETEGWTEVKKLEGHAVQVMGVAFSPDGRSIASGDLQGDVVLWDFAAGRAEKTFKAHAAGVVSLGFAPDGRTFVSASQDGTARVWSFPDGAERRGIQTGQGTLLAAALSPDGALLATAGEDDTVKVWNISSGEIRGSSSMAGTARAVSFSRDGRRIAAAGEGFVSVWETDQPGRPKSLTGTGMSAGGVAILGDGRTVAAAGSDMAVRLWDSGREREPDLLKHHIAPLSALAVSPDGRSFVTLGQDRHLKVWGQLPGGTPRLRPKGFCGIRVQQDASGAVIVAEVIAGTPAATSGLRAGCAIRKVGGAEIHNPTESVDKISSYFEGDEVEFEINSGGTVQTVKVRLGKRPEGLER